MYFEDVTLLKFSCSYNNLFSKKFTQLSFNCFFFTFFSILVFLKYVLFFALKDPNDFPSETTTSYSEVNWWRDPPQNRPTETICLRNNNSTRLKVAHQIVSTTSSKSPRSESKVRLCRFSAFRIYRNTTVVTRTSAEIISLLQNKHTIREATHPLLTHLPHHPLLAHPHFICGSVTTSLIDDRMRFYCLSARGA